MARSAAALAILMGLESGCGPAARIAPEPEATVVTVTPAPEAPPAVAERAERPPPPVVDPTVAIMEGVWEDPETANHTRFTIRVDDGIPTVASAIESIGDKEVFEMRASRWDDGVLSWTYFVPSTRYEVTFTITAVKDDTMSFEWSNSDEKTGTGELQRVDPDAPVEEP